MFNIGDALFVLFCFVFLSAKKNETFETTEGVLIALKTLFDLTFLFQVDNLTRTRVI